MAITLKPGDKFLSCRMAVTGHKNRGIRVIAINGVECCENNKHLPECTEIIYTFKKYITGSNLLECSPIIHDPLSNKSGTCHIGWARELYKPIQPTKPSNRLDLIFND